MSKLQPPELPPLTDPRYGLLTRAVQRLGHVRSFTVAIRSAGSKLDRVLYRGSGGRIRADFRLELRATDEQQQNQPHTAGKRSAHPLDHQFMPSQRRTSLA